MDGSKDMSEVFRNVSQANLTQIVLIVGAAWLLITASGRFLPWLAEKGSGRYRFLLLASTPVLRLMITFIAGVAVLLRLIEPTFENLAALAGAGALALGFAFRDYASSLIAGVVTLYESPYRLGDWIRISGVYGEVKAIDMRAARLVTPDDTTVIVPHLKLWSEPIHNASADSRNLLCVADFYLHPNHDAAAVCSALHDVALTSAFLNVAQRIAVTVAEKPWGTHYRLKAYPTDERRQFDFVSDLTVRGKAALAGLGVQWATAAVTAQS